MQPTRPTTRTRSARLIVMAIVALFALGLSACGDDDDGGNTSAGSDNDSSAGGGSSDDFCQSMKDLEAQVGQSDDLSEGEITNALDSLENVDPPAELSEAWQTMLDSREFIDDPTSASEDDISRIQEASEKIDAYLVDECGIGS
jgi:hypothetical protein